MKKIEQPSISIFESVSSTIHEHTHNGKVLKLEVHKNKRNRYYITLQGLVLLKYDYKTPELALSVVKSFLRDKRLMILQK